MSFCTRPMVPAISAVAAPMTATIVSVSRRMAEQHGVAADHVHPAVTIVAAWMSAETGVGPSIASGSQT